MDPHISGVSALQQSVLIHEEVKEVVVSCFEINLMGLNAIILAKKAGVHARGFGVISGELRSLSLALQAEMHRLGLLAQELLNSATTRLQAERRLARLTDAAAFSAEVADLLAPAMEKTRNKMVVFKGGSKFGECLDDAYQTCTFGLVLARSARIESAYSGELRTILAELSEEFAQKITTVLPRLDALRQITQNLA
ncbi:hypothetical protein HQN60_06835 [Deefgea piscis]|uniref:Methyl-accepting transducer domain-containing protein n=1 Tax=Deefgea piscis TaxID=2739061 RepID=A0A6M8SMR9_9NEIS|nr:hypothetical protein [Deefgea piscis]QKJ66433.1 hypothetical protein HQN60_06835 [Deefgea piscis]